MPQLVVEVLGLGAGFQPVLAWSAIIRTCPKYLSCPELLTCALSSSLLSSTSLICFSTLLLQKFSQTLAFSSPRILHLIFDILQSSINSQYRLCLLLLQQYRSNHLIDIRFILQSFELLRLLASFPAYWIMNQNLLDCFVLLLLRFQLLSWVYMGLQLCSITLEYHGEAGWEFRSLPCWTVWYSVVRAWSCCCTSAMVALRRWGKTACRGDIWELRGISLFFKHKCGLLGNRFDLEEQEYRFEELYELVLDGQEVSKRSGCRPTSAVAILPCPAKRRKLVRHKQHPPSRDNRGPVFSTGTDLCSVS